MYDLETTLEKIGDKVSVILASDINSDLNKFEEDTLMYLTTMIPYRYLPYPTLPTRLTDFSATCIDHIFVQFSTNNLFLATDMSVCPSATPFWLCSHHRIIMKFSGVITSDRSHAHAKGQGQRSKVEVTEVTTQLNRFRTVTPVWIHIWWWNDAYSLIMHRRGALLFLKVIRQISRSHGSKNRWIWPRLGVSGL